MRAMWLSALSTAVLIGCTPAPGGGGGTLPPGEGTTPPADSAPVTQTPSQAATEIVIVKDMAFTPATVTIPAGGTVIWKFEDAIQHSSTSDAGSPKAWDSSILGAGATYTVRFDQPGTYPYHCTPHAAMMKGVVIVQ